MDLQYFAGKNCFIWIGPKPLVFVGEPEIIRDVFNKHALYQKPKSTPLTKLLAQGIVSYEEDKWAKHRKILNPAFHMEKIKVFFHSSPSQKQNIFSCRGEARGQKGFIRIHFVEISHYIYKVKLDSFMYV